MDIIAETFELMVHSYTDADELMNFATTWGLQESLVVRFRLFQLQHTQYTNKYVLEQLSILLDNLGGPLEIPVSLSEEDMEFAEDYVAMQEDIEEAVRALLFDDQMQELAQTCLDDGPWSPPSLPVQSGSGEEPQLQRFSQVR